ncbi:hypothetical protein J7M28_09235 [bacterium]|nr:hypothetical protein [bacterium]
MDKDAVFRQFRAGVLDGYHFIRMPSGKSVAPLQFINRQTTSGGAISGRMTLKIESLSPVHIDNGTMELSEDIGFREGAVVRSILNPGKPIVPGTTLKGATRTIFEAITRSCLSQHVRRTRARYVEGDRRASDLPQQVVRQLVEHGRMSRGAVEVYIATSGYDRRDRCPPVRKKSSRLCPACLLFGAPGFAGRVTFADASLKSSPAKGDYLYVRPSATPRIHKLGRAVVKRVGDSVRVEIDGLKGRKLYGARYRPCGPSHDMELWDYVPTGAVFSSSLIFRGVSMAEVGGLLFSMGIGEKSAIAVGAGKAAGLGKLNLSLEQLCTQPSGLMERMRPDSGGPVADLSRFIRQCKKSFIDSWMAYPKGLEAFRRTCEY